MYAQVTSINVPVGTMSEMRRLIEEEYLPRVRTRPGFVAAYLLEQLDDREAAKLIMFWENQAAVETFNRSGLIEASVNVLASRLPGARVQRQGYHVSAVAEPHADKQTP